MESLLIITNVIANLIVGIAAVCILQRDHCRSNWAVRLIIASLAFFSFWRGVEIGYTSEVPSFSSTFLFIMWAIAGLFWIFKSDWLQVLRDNNRRG